MGFTPGGGRFMRGGIRKTGAVSLGLALLALPGASQARPVDKTATAAAAKPRMKLAAVSSPPRAAQQPGARITVTGRVKNLTKHTRSARVEITLRRTKGAYPKLIGTKLVPRIRPGRTVSYRVRATIPRTMADGTYYMRSCAHNGRSTKLQEPTMVCRYAKRRLTVKKRATPAKPATPATPGTPATPATPGTPATPATPDTPAAPHPGP